MKNVIIALLIAFLALHATNTASSDKNVTMAKDMRDFERCGLSQCADINISDESEPFDLEILLLVNEQWEAKRESSENVIIEREHEQSTNIKTITAYNAGYPNQTDSSPCTAANGEDICIALERGEKVCAGDYPFGTIIHIEGYGDCRITDRLAERYSHRIDIAFKKDELQLALNWGIQQREVHIIN